MKSLILPSADNWFKSVFGDALGVEFAGVTLRARNEIERNLPAMFAALRNQKLTEIEAVRFDESCNPLATPTEYPLLLLREHPEPLYDVRFTHDASKTSIMSYFAYVGGGFRYIGSFKKGRSATPSNPQPRSSQQSADSSVDDNSKRIVVDQKVQNAQLVRQEIPVYPPEAKRRHLQGSVTIHATITKDGAVTDLDLIEGHCWLAQSAMKAVKSWHYRPTLLQGQPVEVDTMVTVTFALH
ncbi:MAG: energy transducer TonB [Candidatus Acidiferrales bacterium]